MAVDTVQIRAIRVDASLGVLPWERQVRQPIEVDVDAEVDTTELLASGDLTRGVDFSMVIDRVQRIVQVDHVDLVEVLADRIARALLAETPATAVRVRVRKYSACAGAAAYVGVQVRRGRWQAESEEDSDADSGRGHGDAAGDGGCRTGR